MPMTGYTKLFSSIVTSTVWGEPDHVRLVWITMLALSNRDGIVEASIPGLAKMAGVAIENCEAALQRLEGPDKYSRTKDFEGRRITPIDGGWQLINHRKYRDKLSKEERTEYNKIKQQESRQRKLTNADSADGVDMSALSAHTDNRQHLQTTSTNKITPSRRASRSVPVSEPTDFADFWDHYPNHKGKEAALKAWRKLNPDTNLIGVMASALAWHRRQPQWTKDRGQFVPMLSTWINGRRWEDEPFEVPQPRVSSDWQDECQHQPKCPNAFFHEAKLMP